ncbi:MAG: RpiB/LacA/LacB family sugar-phosphate isomerase [Elusimicrobiota bacterium]|jgi:ribose 5-phosphate isomerase B|nr:RpiB/LacA/LacB family sugar-phosphate isomerase [Elusimicrobiota bacterium]
MIVAVASDHAGFTAKEIIVKEAKRLGHEVLDLGTNDCSSVDYPDYALKAAELVASGKAQRGILACGSGIGMCIVANKVKGARASIAHDVYSAAQGIEHNDMNILCIGGKVVDHKLTPQLVEAFLNASFLKGEERFERRSSKIKAIESANFK